jgi:hypothetical protein
MGIWRDFFLGQPLKKENEGEDKPREVEKVEPPKDPMEFSGSISFEKFEDIVAGGRDGYQHYKGLHGEYKERMEKRLKDIVESRKKEGLGFSKQYIHDLAKTLNNESDRASKELAKLMGYKA